MTTSGMKLIRIQHDDLVQLTLKKFIAVALIILSFLVHLAHTASTRREFENERNFSASLTSVESSQDWRLVQRQRKKSLREIEFMNERSFGLFIVLTKMTINEHDFPKFHIQSMDFLIQLTLFWIFFYPSLELKSLLNHFVGGFKGFVVKLRYFGKLWRLVGFDT